MAFDLHVIESEVREVPKPVEYHGQELKVLYKPAAITTAFAAKMSQAEKDNDVEAMASGAQSMLHDWDMVRDKQKIAPSLDVLRQLPIGLLGAIFQACMEDATAGEDTKKA